MVEDLQRRLQEARVSEAALPADIDRLQAELQYEFSRVQSREAGGRSGSICESVGAKLGAAKNLIALQACERTRAEKADRQVGSGGGHQQLRNLRICKRKSSLPQNVFAFAALAATGAAQQADLAALQEEVSCYSLRLGLRLEPRVGSQRESSLLRKNASANCLHL